MSWDVVVGDRKDGMKEAIELDRLRRHLMYAGFVQLGLRHLEPLREEIEERLHDLNGQES